MKSTEELRFDALIRARDFCILNNIALSAITEYAALKALLDSCIANIISARAINMADISNFAVAKSIAMNTMVDAVFKFMLRGAVKAAEINNADLEHLLNHPITYFQIHDAATVGVRCTEIKNIINTNIGVLTNIEPADVLAMEAAIAAFELLLNAPKEAIDNRKALGTARIKELLDISDAPRNNIGKVIYSYLPILVNGWVKAITVGISSSVRHTSIVIKFTDEMTGVVLKNVKCTFNNELETIVKMSTKRGYARVFSLLTGNWSAKCEHPVYTTQTIVNIGVDDLHIARYAVVLKKKTI